MYNYNQYYSNQGKINRQKQTYFVCGVHCRVYVQRIIGLRQYRVQPQKMSFKFVNGAFASCIYLGGGKKRTLHGHTPNANSDDQAPGIQCENYKLTETLYANCVRSSLCVCHTVGTCNLCAGHGSERERKKKKSVSL